MAGGSVKLSIYSTFKDDGTKQAEKAVDRFAKKFGKLDSSTGKMGLDSATEALVRQSVAADQAAARWAGYSDKLAAAGEKITKYVSAPAGAAVAASVKLASDYEDAFAKVKTIMDKSAVPAEQLQHDILELSTSTGKAAGELADATYQALSASVDTSQVAGFVEQSVKLAKAGFSETSTAVDVLTTTINAYGLSADQAGMISERLVQTQNKGKTTVAELASSMGNVIPTAAAYGVNLDNLCSAYVLLTKQGINTANSTTAINGMLTELADDGSGVAKILKEETGKSFGQLMNDGMDLGQVLSILNDHVGGDSEAFANLWGNVRASKGALAIANAGAEAFAETMADMENSTGLVDAALEDLVTPSERAGKALNAAKNVGIELGQEFLGALAPALERGVELAQAAFDAFDGMSAGEKQAVAQAFALAAAAGPAVLGLSKMAGGVSAALSAYGRLAANLAKVSTGAGRAAASAKLLGTATSNAATLGVAVLAVAVAACAKGIVDHKRRLDDMADATKLLAAATTSGVPSLEAAAGASDDHAEALRREKVSVEEVTRAQAELAREIEKRNSSAQSEIGSLERAKSTIHEYANKTNLTAQEQGRLRAAVELVNQECGTQYTVVDAANGVLADEEGQVLKNVDAIDQYIAKKQEQVRVEAISKDLEGLYEQRKEDLAALGSATRDYNQAVGELKQAEEAGVTGDAWLEKRQAVDDAAQALGEARADADQCEAAIGELEKRLGSAANAASGGEQTVSDLARGMDELTGNIPVDAFDSFCGHLESTGVSVEAFSALNRDQLIDLANAYDGTVGSVERALDGLGVSLPQKSGAAVSGAAGAISGASGAMVASAQGASATVLRAFDSMKPGAAAAGASGANAYASGISGGKGQVSSAAGQVGSAAKGMKVSGSYGWGADLAGGFASGILSKLGSVASAASQVASAAAAPIRHSVPKTGPLHNRGRGEAGWGEETVGNYARGMVAATGYVRAAATAAATAAAAGLQAHSAPSPAGVIPAAGASQQAAFADLLAAKLAAQIAAAMAERPTTVNNWGGISYTDETAVGGLLSELARAVEVEEGC